MPEHQLYTLRPLKWRDGTTNARRLWYAETPFGCYEVEQTREDYGFWYEQAVGPWKKEWEVGFSRPSIGTLHIYSYISVDAAKQQAEQDWLERIGPVLGAINPQEEIERLQEIISGALAHSLGPYSDKNLLRRVVLILRKAAEPRKVTIVTAPLGLFKAGHEAMKKAAEAE